MGAFVHVTTLFTGDKKRRFYKKIGISLNPVRRIIPEEILCLNLFPMDNYPHACSRVKLL